MNIRNLLNFLLLIALSLVPSTYALDAQTSPASVNPNKEPGVERTLVILKPDCIEKKIVGDVITRFENYGLEIRGIKMMLLPEALLREHYAHSVGKAYFPELLAYMSSGPVIVMVLEGKNAIEEVRTLIGSTDPHTAQAGTIRFDYGSNKTRNVVHASDSIRNANIEINRFFKPDEIFE